MNKTLTMLALVATAALAGCDQSDHTITAEGPYDPQANAANAAAPVVLPPSIVASHSYRCKDNSLVFIDWMSDGGARVKNNRDERATPVVVGGDGPLTGDSQAKTITYNGQACTR